MRRLTSERIHSLSTGARRSLSRSPSASIGSRFPTSQKGGNIRSREKIRLSGIFQRYLSSLTVNIRAERKMMPSVVSATTLAWGYSSPQSAARFWRVRERRELDGKYRRNGSLNLCIRERPMKKAHLLHCARPTRSNVPQRVRLHSSVFARLASKTFLIGLMRLLIGDIKRRKLILLLLVWTSAVSAQTIKLKVAYPTTVGSMAVLWVAKDARLFEKQGLEVELIYVAGSSKVVQAMLAKEIPISEIAIPAVIQANIAGADLVMLAGPNNKPGQKIMVKPEIKTPENLKGKKIGITRFGTSDDFLLRYILGQWKIQPERDVALLQMGGSPE